MNKPNHKNYSRADLISYVSGQMTEKKMYDLESASLSDPFLNDALEGYANVTTTDDDLDFIHATIKKKSTSLGGSSGVFKIYRLLSVAATLLVISFSAYFLLKKESPAPATSPVLAKNETPSKTQNLSENTATGTNQMVTAQSTQTQKKAEMNQQQRSSSSASWQAMEKPVMTESVIASDDVSDKTEYKNASKFKTDSAVFAVADTKQLTAGNDAAQVRKDVSTVNGSTVETESVLAAVDLNEVAVTSAINTRKKKPEARSASLQKVKAEDIKEAGSGTYSHFDDFVRNNRKTIQDSAGNTIHGLVMLSFKIDKSGRPRNIRIEKSLGTSCDEEAKRLLQQGPKWPATSGRIKTTVSF